MARSVAGAAPSRLNRKFLLAAVVLAVLSAVLVYAKISAKGGSSSGTVAAGSQQVVIAKTAIQPRTTITPQMLELKSVPSNLVVAGAFSKLDDVVGKVTKFPIDVNQQVISAAVVDLSKPATTLTLSVVVPTGKRAMSIQTNQVSNAGGLILPGDWVDIIWACCKGAPVVAKTILRNVQVAAVAQSIVNSGPVQGSKSGNGASSTAPIAAEPGKPVPDAQTVTLLLGTDQAQQIFLAEQNGTLRAELRGVNDQDTADPGPVRITQLLVPSDLAGLPDVLKPEGYKPGQ